MDEAHLMIIAALYAAVVAVSYKKFGLINALIWPLIIIMLGFILYFSTVFKREE